MRPVAEQHTAFLGFLTQCADRFVKLTSLLWQRRPFCQSGKISDRSALERALGNGVFELRYSLWMGKEIEHGKRMRADSSRFPPSLVLTENQLRVDSRGPRTVGLISWNSAMTHLLKGILCCFSSWSQIQCICSLYAITPEISGCWENSFELNSIKYHLKYTTMTEKRVGFFFLFFLRISLLQLKVSVWDLTYPFSPIFSKGADNYRADCTLQI